MRWTEANFDDKKTPIISVSDLLDKYLTEVTPNKRGWREETYRINAIKRDDIGAIRISKSSQHVEADLDRRLNKVASSSLNVLIVTPLAYVQIWGKGHAAFKEMSRARSFADFPNAHSRDSFLLRKNTIEAFLQGYESRNGGCANHFCLRDGDETRRDFVDALAFRDDETTLRISPKNVTEDHPSQLNG